jgi:hypothetical protein
VLVDELPALRQTLPLRLMARGAPRRVAIQELGALPPHAWERRHLAPLLVDLHKTLSQTTGSRLLTKEEKELLVNGQKMIEAIENRGRKAGLKQGLEQGLQQGREQGLEPLVHQVTRKLGRPPTDRERATLARRLDTLGPSRLGDVVLDLDAPALAAWLANPRAR